MNFAEILRPNRAFKLKRFKVFTGTRVNASSAQRGNVTFVLGRSITSRGAMVTVTFVEGLFVTSPELRFGGKAITGTAFEF